jgi:hypothetical protein
MKALPCKFCHDGVATLPDKSRYLLERMPERRGAYTYRCSSCLRTNSITATEFNRLPQEPEQTEP